MLLSESNLNTRRTPPYPSLYCRLRTDNVGKRYGEDSIWGAVPVPWTIHPSPKIHHEAGLTSVMRTLRSPVKTLCEHYEACIESLLTLPPAEIQMRLVSIRLKDSRAKTQALPR